MNKYQQAPLDEGAPYQQEDQSHRSPIREALCQTILVLLCLASYHHAINGEFVFDDTVAIVKNSDVTTLPTNYTAIFRHDFWGVELTNPDSHKSFRPLTTLMFHMEYAQMGLGAKHMKAINLMLHCINTLLVWKLLCDLKFDFVEQQLLRSEQVATITSALFAIHPVHTEAVCGIVGRAELVFCMVYLLALLLTKTREHLGAAADMLVISLTTIGLLFKETAVTIPLACVFFDYMRSEVYFVRPVKRMWGMIFSLRNICYAIATVVLIILRLWIQNFESPHFKPVDNPVAFSVNPLTRVLSQHYLYVVNIWILLCPQWLSFDWALGCVELITNMWDFRLQAVLALYSLVMVSLINFKNNSGPILGLGLLVIPFLPACGIIKVGFVIAERILYVPSIGFCLLVSYAFVYLYGTIKQKWLLAILKGMLLLVFACFLLRTRQRANDWLNEESLFSSALSVCPKNAKVHYNIARLATDKLDHEKALHHYHQAIELFPQYESALMNLGNLYRETGDLERAEKYIKSALEVLPEFPAAWMNLGIVQSARKKFTEALISYEQALKYRKKYAICHYNMGNLFLDQKLYSEAMHHWQEAVALNPRQPKAWANILTMLDNRGLYEDAVRLSDKALKHLPNETNILFIRANVFGKLKHYVEAETLYRRVIKMEPMNMLYHTNLGVLYHRWGKLNLAIDSYQRALKLNPEKAKTAQENLSKILKRKTKEK